MMRGTALSGRSAIITGASQGLGREVAASFLSAGARVLICARTANDLASATDSLGPLSASPENLIAEVGDVSSVIDTTRFVTRALSAWGHIDILVNNAGIYGPIGASDAVDWDDWVRAIEINLFGSVLMARAVLPHMKERRCGKIIQVSGGGATNPLPRLTSYAASKAAVVRFAESLADEVREFNIDVNSVAPGALDTRMLDEVLASGPDAAGAAFHTRMQRIKEQGGTPLEKAASLVVFLASAESDGISGRLISAAWDQWASLPARKTDLSSTDIYTIRRITAADRGKDWDRS